MYRFFIILALAGLMIFNFTAFADPSEESSSRKTQEKPTEEPSPTTPSQTVKKSGHKEGQKISSLPARLGALPIESDWHGRAQKWFSSRDTVGRRKEMRKMTRALKQPCRYCHTPDFKGYTDKKLISQQMMAISAEYQVACSDCHSGKIEMTPMGTIAMSMWKLAHEKKVECNHCHMPGDGFLNLTQAGQSFLESGP